MKEEKLTHESYGMLQISRGTCSPGINLFGSSIKHRNIINLRISTGELHRQLSSDWYFDKDTLIEVIMSSTQFAEAITTLNHGSGVPVTLLRVNGKSINPCPTLSKTAQFNQEFKEDMQEASKFMESAINKAEALLENVNKSKIKDLISELESIKNKFSSTIPLVQERFTEQMDKTVSEAKGEVESFITNAVIKLGNEKLREQMPQLEFRKE